MTTTARWTRLATACLLLVGCGTASSSWDGEVTFRIDIEDGQRWTARGDPVDQGEICPDGIRAVLGAADAETGERLRIREEVQILFDVIDRPIQPPVVWTVEHSCTDGSGAFVTEEDWGTGTWTVLSGTGSYRELRGDGSLTFTTDDYTRIGPRRITVHARLTGPAPR